MSINYNYRKMTDFCGNMSAPSSNPLSYCMVDGLSNSFLHSGNAYTLNNNSKQCQDYMAEYCAAKWDGYCEVASQRTDTYYPNQKFTAGEMLLRHTAMRKYLYKMNGGQKIYEKFDPTVASSPYIYSWSGGIPEYMVNPKEIDSDPVMNKIVQNSRACVDILVNIYETMRRYNKVKELKGTNIGKFFELNGMMLN